MQTIQHPFIKQDTVESRQYQLAIAMQALEENTLVVLPTGLGKTVVALLVAASRLLNAGGRVLILAPTKPLVEQHLTFFERTLELPDKQEGDCVSFTGNTPPKKRSDLFERSRFCCATPQVIQNDIINGRYSLSDVSLLIVDECHRAVGNYAYTYLAEEYMRTAKKPLILGMTASPGSQASRVSEVCTHLGITNVETRDETDPDVLPYIHERTVEFIQVELPVPLKRIVQIIEGMIDSRIGALAGLGYSLPKREGLSMKALSDLNTTIQERIAAGDATAYQAASLYAEIMKLRHAVILAESQGSIALSSYLQKLDSEGRSKKGSKASQRMVKDYRFSEVMRIVSGLSGEIHPKAGIVASIIRDQLINVPESKIIVFASYRDSVSMLVQFLSEEGITGCRFVGQASKQKDKGLSQKKQIEAIQRFRGGEYPVLVATSVGEEGLDIPATDLVIFYEAVPSEIRSIQRKGRTGRSGKGSIIVLVTKGTSDETFRYVSSRKEKAMASGVRRLQNRSDRDEIQSVIESFTPADESATTPDEVSGSNEPPL
ncbi:helicase-related protein [Methanocalculus sp.]|uniref:helicase-related protein n=1 Tax=Methanocalculus sp. TaxID=2004547 RepID=UPI002721CE52|nr:helicase-related protein [Methanocalculus sp.]MDO8841250.1 helicase-related protein [Methanocalculus sp.]